MSHFQKNFRPTIRSVRGLGREGRRFHVFERNADWRDEGARGRKEGNEKRWLGGEKK